MSTCVECGFTYDEGEALGAADAIVAGASEVAALVNDAGDDEVRARTDPATWSPLEYACHVRDVLLVQRERVLEARRTECPSFTPMGRDERVDHDGYGEQDPAAVTRQLADAADLFANVLSRLDDDEWDRTVMYNYPGFGERTLRWVAVHTVHEVRHHTLDIRAQLT
jgi:hypothetical protein